MNLYGLAAERNRRLERADRKITRCPECGAWRWQYACTVDHDSWAVTADLEGRRAS